MESVTGPDERVLGREVVRKGRKFDFEVVSLRLGSGREVEREFVRHPGAVVVVGVHPDGLVLIRNRRFGVGETLWECCAGTAEAGEDPAVTAGREFIEETGYRASELISLGWFYTSPGMSDERMHVFVARGLTHVGQDLEEDERIEVEVVPVSRAMEMVENGQMRDGKSMTALLLGDRRGLLRA